jgi:predicted membrane-bound mannosyltransferase/streptogramin lyase
LGLLILLVLGTRFTQLGYRAFHHDESIHSYYSWKIVHDSPTAYRYDPVYHGPFLYHFGAACMSLLPDSDTTARFPFALTGVFSVLVFLAWCQRLGRGTPMLLVLLLTFSTVVTYFSRFAREDVHMMAWLTGMTVFGGLYLWTCRVRYLNLAVLFVVLSYCTKESSYVNTFLPCSFLIAWGIVRLYRGGWTAAKEVLECYLPLLRILVVFGSFSVFVFTYVALDVRVSPETGLARGVLNILSHSTAIAEKTDAKILTSETGYFSKPGRQGVRQAYLYLAFGSTVLLLIVLEATALWFGRSPQGQSSGGILGWAARVLMATVFYLLAVQRVLSLAEWIQATGQYSFWRELAGHLGETLLVLGLAASAFILPEVVPATVSSDGRKTSSFLERIRRQSGYLTGLYSLVFQLVLAMGLFLVLFSSLGTNLRSGARDGLYAYLSYWFKHQTGDFRIWGPWWYYIPRLLLFELVPLTLIGLSTLLLFKEWIRKRIQGAPTSPPEAARLTSQESLESPSSGNWRPIPLPLRWFAVYQGLFLLGVYSILNEKVPWLCTYPAYGISFLAAILSGHWLATHPAYPGPLVGRLMDLLPGGGCPRSKRLWRGGWTVTLALVSLFTLGQYLSQIFMRPDDPTELLVYTGTTPEFAGKVRKVARMEMESGNKLKIAVEGKAEWPCVWYFRNYDVRWKTVDLTCDIQILDDTPEGRRRMQPRRGKVWEVEPCDLRGWWIWHGTREALPGNLTFLGNLEAFLTNSPNDHRAIFPEESRPIPSQYSVGFRNQVLRYAFFRQIWFPVGGERVLVCFKSNTDIPVEASRGYLEGSEKSPRFLRPLQTISSRGSGPGQFLEPRGMTRIPDGRIAVVDSKNGRVQVFSASGEFVFEFGKGILNPEYSGPSDVACDPEGNFYVADTWNHALRKFAPSGELLSSVTSWEGSGQPKAGLFGPRGVALDHQGVVYITDTGNKFVRAYSSDLRPLLTWGGSGQEPGRFIEPVGIAVDHKDRVYVVDTGNGRIQRFTSKGEFDKEFLTFTPMENDIVAMEPHVEVLPDGRLVTTMSSTGTIWIIDPEKMFAAVYRVQAPNFLQPLGVTTDGGKGFWVSSRSSSALSRMKAP